MTEILNIACDEAGYTGPDLLNPEQRYFGFGSVSIDDTEAYGIIQKALRDHPVQMPELKAAKLMRTERGRSLIAALVDAADGRFAVNVLDKLLALGGWVFEYIYEPVYQDDPWLLYEKNLHRFVAMFTWLWFNEAGSEAKQAVEQFQKYMRTRNEADAPLLFDRIRAPLSKDGTEHPFEMILRFAHGYRDIILADNARLGTETSDAGRWILDLSASGLWSHLNHWGKSGRLLCVRCDTSKPLESIVSHFTGDENDPGIKRARRKGHSGPLGWRLAKPLSFVDSRDHPAVQLADVIAGTAVAFLVNGMPDGFDETIQRIHRHMLQDTVLPDLEVIDLKNRSAAVNALILYDLAQRAERGRDPYSNLAEMYRTAEVSWVRGEFKPIVASWSQTRPLPSKPST